MVSNVARLGIRFKVMITRLNNESAEWLPRVAAQIRCLLTGSSESVSRISRRCRPGIGCSKVG